MKSAADTATGVTMPITRPAPGDKHDGASYHDHDRHDHGDRAADEAAELVVGGLVDILLTPSSDPYPDQAMPPDVGAAMRSQGLDWATYPAPELYAGISLWDVLSGADEHGKKIQRQDGLDDPAIAASQTIQQALVTRYSLSPAPSLPLQDDAPGALVYAATPARYLLSVRTVEWGVERYTLRPGRYYVELKLELRLVDTREHALLAKGGCDVDPSYDGDAPVKAELLADQGALLKKLLQTDIDRCVAQLETYTLSLPPPAG